MRFKDALYDGSDPLYAPCLSKVGRYFFWKAPAKYVTAGCSLKSVPLAGLDETARAARCRELTRDMLQWYEGRQGKVTPGTWGTLIARYKSDDISPFRDVQPNTRDNYIRDIGYWEAAIGHTMVADMTFEQAKMIERGMQAKGRSRHFIKAKFTMLRLIASYGVAIKWSGARDAREVLGELKLKSPKPRASSPTEEQVLAIVAAADNAGDTAFATGLLAQWRLTLRAMDVRGDYFRLQGGEDRSGICRGGFRWGKGLLWTMINRDVSSLTKTPSKTDESLPEEIVWDLTIVPDLRARLQAIPADRRAGPVIVDRAGMPFDRFMWSKLWRKHRKAAGVPASIWMMDTRAGAINDAKRKGASKIEMQQQANHASGQTTERYIRERSAGVNNVLRIRAERS